MNINRHNYEEFFLLYVDNELTPAQKRLVDTFVAVNPDLQEEFRLINDTKLNFNAVLDEGFKTSLLKPIDEETIITEDQLLLYIDNELKADERAAVDEAVAKSYQLQKELQLLKRTVSEPDAAVVFANKSLLYKETEPARIFYMGTAAKRWVAAAAVILLLGSAVWVSLTNGTKVDGPVAKNPVLPKTEQSSNPPVAEQQTIVKDNSVQQPLVQQPVPQPAAPKTNTGVKVITTAVQQTNTALVKNNNQQQQLPVIQQQPEQETIAVNIKPTVTFPENIPSQESNKTSASTVPLAESTASNTTVIYNEDESGEPDERFLNEERQRKLGLRSFAKKAKRLFERTTGIKSDDSEVRFAVFAVNTQ